MSDRLLVSTRKGLFAVERHAAGWASRCIGFLGDNVTLTTPVGGRWYAALNLGHFGVKLHASDDGGMTWTECGVPEYPPGETIATMDGKPPTPATLKLIWSLESDGETLWAGTGPGGLFRSTDHGRTWTLNRPLWDRPERGQWMGGGYDVPAIHSICIDPRDRNIIRIAISCGGALLTTDAGQSWRTISRGLFADFMPPEQRENPDVQDAHMMVQCPAMPDHLWIQHHNGIFRSTDGETWTYCDKATPSGFGFAVAVHPTDGNTAWFIPAVKDEKRVPVDGKLVVTRTRDGGQSFESLTRGLPTCPAYDIVYRHGLAIDSTGQCLAFGTTSGGVWITDNGGDEWTMLDARLPPIHAVRWIL